MIDTKQIRESVATICQKYGEEYWRALDKKKEFDLKMYVELTHGFGLRPEEALGLQWKNFNKNL